MPKLLLSFDTGQWQKDGELSKCSNSTRGIWMDLICAMHERDRSGELSGTADQLAADARFTTAELIDALRELKEQQAAYVYFNGSVFTIRNRRMYRSAAKRKANAERQMRYRESNAQVSVTPEDIAFQRFWLAFPAGRKRSKAKAREAFQKAVTKADAETIITSASEYAASEVARGKYVKMPETWLNQECWSDDREAWCDLDNKAPAAFRKVTREEFLQAVKDRQFVAKPQRATSDPCWVFGALTDGTKIECRNYWPPKQNNGANAPDDTRGN